MNAQLGKCKASAVSVLVPALLFCLACWQNDAKSETVTPKNAYNFISSTGVATHFSFGRSKYRTQYSTVRSYLGDLGVLHIRDGLGNKDALTTFKNLWQTVGVKLTGVLDQRTGSGGNQHLAPDQIQGKINEIKTYLGADALEAIEGPNEPNLVERDFGQKWWVGEIQAYQTKLFQSINADPLLKGKPVIAPALGGPDLNYFYGRLNRVPFASDQGSAHVYPNWLPFVPKFEEVAPVVKSVAPGRKIAITETGWHSAVNAGTQFVTEAVRAKYLPRAMVSYHVHGDIARAFIYQLVDHLYDPNFRNNPSQMALINYNLQPKPAFFAVRNMMHIMCDTNKPFASTNLNYTLSGNMADVEQVLYQKTNRAYYLPIWLEKQSMQKSGPINNGSRAIKIQFGNSVKIVRLYRPSDASGATYKGNQPRQTFSNVSSLDLTIYDDITVLEIVPNGVDTPALPNGCRHT